MPSAPRIQRLIDSAASLSKKARLCALLRFVFPYVVSFLTLLWAGHAVMHRPAGTVIRRAAGEIIRLTVSSKFDPNDPAMLVVDSSGIRPPPGETVTPAAPMIALIDAVRSCGPSAIAIDYDFAFHQKESVYYAEHKRIVEHCLRAEREGPPIVLGVGDAIFVEREDWFHVPAAAGMGASMWLPNEIRSQPCSIRLGARAGPSTSSDGDRAKEETLHSLGCAVVMRTKAARPERSPLMRRLVATEGDPRDRFATGSFAIDLTPLKTRERWTVRPELTGDAPHALPKLSRADCERIKGRMVFIGVAEVAAPQEPASDVFPFEGGTLTGVYLHACGAWSWLHPVNEIDERYELWAELFLLILTLAPSVALFYSRKEAEGHDSADHVRLHHDTEKLRGLIRLGNTFFLGLLAVILAARSYFWLDLAFVVLAVLFEPIVESLLTLIGMTGSWAWKKAKVRA